MFETELNYSKYLLQIVTLLLSVNITDSDEVFILRRSLCIL
jgi:hypothetical protein